VKRNSKNKFYGSFLKPILAKFQNNDSGDEEIDGAEEV